MLLRTSSCVLGLALEVYPTFMSTTTDSTSEPGFEPALFWDLHKAKIIIYGLLVVAALAGYGIFHFNATRKAAHAQAMLATASKADDYRAVISTFPRTAEAANATLLLAAELRKSSKFDEALALLRSFPDLYPKSPLASGAALSLANTLQAQGKNDEAIEAFQSVYSRYSTSYSAPLAMLARAGLLKSMGKTEEARRGYENLIAQHPESYVTPEAREQLRLLK